MVAPSNHFDHCMVATVKLEQLAFFLCFAPPSLPGNVPLVEVVFFQRFASPSPCLPHWLDVHGTLCGTLGQFVYFLWRCPSASSVHRILLHLVLAFPPLSASPTTSPWVAHWTLYSPMCTLRSLPHMQDQLCRVDLRSVGENVDLDTGSRTQGPPRLPVSLATWPLVQTGGSQADRAKKHET